MNQITTERGFQLVKGEGYDTMVSRGSRRVVQQSSAIGDYADSFDRPGSSFLWLGEHHHFSREEVQELVGYLNHWLKTGWLFPREEPPSPDLTLESP